MKAAAANQKPTSNTRSRGGGVSDLGGRPQLGADVQVGVVSVSHLKQMKPTNQGSPGSISSTHRAPDDITHLTPVLHV